MIQSIVNNLDYNKARYNCFAQQEMMYLQHEWLKVQQIRASCYYLTFLILLIIIRLLYYTCNVHRVQGPIYERMNATVSYSKSKRTLKCKFGSRKVVTKFFLN